MESEKLPDGNFITRVGRVTPQPSEASPENLFPKSRQGCLDAELLKKMGLTQARMVNEDAQFFLQLLLLMCDPAKSGIDGDFRHPYYTKVEGWMQKYATGIGLGEGCMAMSSSKFSLKNLFISTQPSSEMKFMAAVMEHCIVVGKRVAQSTTQESRIALRIHGGSKSNA